MYKLIRKKKIKEFIFKNLKDKEKKIQNQERAKKKKKCFWKYLNFDKFLKKKEKRKKD